MPLRSRLLTLPLFFTFSVSAQAAELKPLLGKPYGSISDFDCPTAARCWLITNLRDLWRIDLNRLAVTRMVLPVKIDRDTPLLGRVFFQNDDDGLVLYVDRLLETTDAGQTWRDVPLPEPHNSPVDLRVHLQDVAASKGCTWVVGWHPIKKENIKEPSPGDGGEDPFFEPLFTLSRCKGSGQWVRANLADISPNNASLLKIEHPGSVLLYGQNRALRCTGACSEWTEVPFVGDVQMIFPLEDGFLIERNPGVLEELSGTRLTILPPPMTTAEQPKAQSVAPLPDGSLLVLFSDGKVREIGPSRATWTELNSPEFIYTLVAADPRTIFAVGEERLFRVDLTSR